MADMESSSGWGWGWWIGLVVLVILVVLFVWWVWCGCGSTNSCATVCEPVCCDLATPTVTAATDIDAATAGTAVTLTGTDLNRVKGLTYVDGGTEVFEISNFTANSAGTSLYFVLPVTGATGDSVQLCVAGESPVSYEFTS